MKHKGVTCLSRPAKVLFVGALLLMLLSASCHASVGATAGQVVGQAAPDDLPGDTGDKRVLEQEKFSRYTLLFLLFWLIAAALVVRLILEVRGRRAAQKRSEKAEAELHKLQSHLQQLDKMETLGALAGGMAHDFNNILTSIIGFAELSRMGTSVSGGDERHLQMIMDAATRGRELIKQMLDFSLRREQQKKPLRLSEIVREIVRFLRASIPANINISLTVKSESAPVFGDPIQLQQLIMNLCSNAAHSMNGRGGRLDLQLGDFIISEPGTACNGMSAGLYMKLVVRDTGVGIPRDVIDKIFDPFFTTKRPEEGTGLGLSVVKCVLRQHAGHITVESDVKEGTTFTVYLPTIKEQPGLITHQ